MATQVEMTGTEQAVDIVQGNENIALCKGEEVAVIDSDPPEESALSRSGVDVSDSPSNNDEMLRSSTAVENPATEEKPVACHSVKSEEPMEVTGSLDFGKLAGETEHSTVTENLHFENRAVDKLNGNDGGTEHPTVTGSLHFENHAVDKLNGNDGETDHSTVTGSLPIENCAVHELNGNDGEAKHSTLNAFSQVCVTMESECDVELKDNASEDSSSDSDSDSSSSSSSSSSLMSMIRAEEEEPMENSDTPLKTKDELLVDDLPEVEVLSISLPEDVEIKPFGKVSSIIEQLVIIESSSGIPPLNDDTIVFGENRLAVGKIFEIFGPVPHPFYVVRFNSKEHIESIGIKLIDTMYFAPGINDYTQYIIPDALKRDKGSDASWTNDQEPPAEVLDYSDDEKEKEAKQKKKAQNTGKKKQKAEKDNSSGSRESNQHYGGQQFSRPYSRNGSAPRFSNRQGASMQGNAFRHQEPYFPSEVPGPHMMQHPYAYHNTNPQDYSMTYANNGHQPPPPHLYENYQNIQRFPPPPFPPPHMWHEQNMHFTYMQNYLPPPPPPPPPPHSHPGNPDY